MAAHFFQEIQNVLLRGLRVKKNNSGLEDARTKRLLREVSTPICSSSILLLHVVQYRNFDAQFLVFNSNSNSSFSNKVVSFYMYEYDMNYGM